MKKVIFSMFVGGVIGHVITKQQCEIETMKKLHKIDREVAKSECYDFIFKYGIKSQD